MCSGRVRPEGPSKPESSNRSVRPAPADLADRGATSLGDSAMRHSKLQTTPLPVRSDARFPKNIGINSPFGEGERGWVP